MALLPRLANALDATHFAVGNATYWLMNRATDLHIAATDRTRTLRDVADFLRDPNAWLDELPARLWWGGSSPERTPSAPVSAPATHEGPGAGREADEVQDYADYQAFGGGA